MNIIKKTVTNISTDFEDIEFVFEDKSWVEFHNIPKQDNDSYTIYYEAEWPDEKDYRESDFMSGDIDIESNEVIDFDGCYMLPNNVITALRSLKIVYSDTIDIEQERGIYYLNEIKF